MDINQYENGQVNVRSAIVPKYPNLPTHHSHAGSGGYVEVPTMADLYNIPSLDNPTKTIDSNGVTSGKRKLGMIVHVLQEGKYYQLKPKFKDSKKTIGWDILSAIPDDFRGLLMNPTNYTYVEVAWTWSELSSLVGATDYNSLIQYGYYDGGALQDGVIVGAGGGEYAVPVYGVPALNSDPWTEIEVLDTNKSIIGNSSVKNIIALTQTQYDAIAVKNPTTLYIIDP